MTTPTNDDHAPAIAALSEAGALLDRAIALLRPYESHAIIADYANEALSSVEDAGMPIDLAITTLRDEA